MTQVTRTIAGHEVSLTAGVRYVASRPIATHYRKVFPVNITKAFSGIPAVTIPDLTYEQANQFINEFNNGSISFEGRVW